MLKNNKLSPHSEPVSIKKIFVLRVFLYQLLLRPSMVQAIESCRAHTHTERSWACLHIKKSGLSMVKNSFFDHFWNPLIVGVLRLAIAWHRFPSVYLICKASKSWFVSCRWSLGLQIRFRFRNTFLTHWEWLFRTFIQVASGIFDSFSR